jgi:transcriptional activator of glycolytic enzymes GCR1
LRFKRSTPGNNLRRAVNTVTKLWEEWMVGIEGKPAVKELEIPSYRPKGFTNTKTWYLGRGSNVTIMFSSYKYNKYTL